MKWLKGDIIYSSQMGDFARRELEHLIGKGGSLEITVRENSREKRLPFERKRKERRKGGRREYCCYVVDLKETTVKSITALIMVKISNIHWIKICL